ncbi:hypothetical protein B0F90DRAFT_1694934 [Multifurca ochricompacta]|uniref:C3H1-type domain-containing protein n=1 Tax=Multifurca ochricompacta TaxID=376703 RepID=A0AAD4MBD1_9AGAM|nr:hypothetical protein B0F90DRAFT_1694934 [Multifurca ochricompacta]
MLSSLLAVPRPIPEPGNIPDSASVHDSAPTSAPTRFPHTRAQLSSISRLYKPADSCENDTEPDDSPVSSSLIAKVASLLDHEHEDELKALLKATFTGIDDDMLEQHVLDLMHKHRDDIAGVPFLFLTASRRPISRPSSRASSHSARLVPNRPDTPNSAPSSPLAYVFRRPHTPLASPLATGQGPGSYMTASSDSPAASPTLPHAMPRTYTQFANSLPSSPIGSHRVLSAKASDFRPYPRPLSAASSNPSTLTALRADTPSPDLWAHGNSKVTSNLAIAAPLIPDTSLLSRSGTPNSTLRVSVHPDEEDEEDDPFDPFSQKALPRSFHPPTLPEFDPQWTDSPTSNTSLSDGYRQLGMADRLSPPNSSQLSQDSYSTQEPEGADMLTEGMTPFDVLASVFGTSLAPSELEEALAANGYDLSRAAPQHGHSSQHLRSQNLGNRISLVSRDGAGAVGYVRGGRAGFGPPNAGAKGAAKFPNGRPVQTGTRVCRYFLAGECLRADCRFSHEIERALCRFWLRGTCAKGEVCEFLHHIPADVDVAGITAAMGKFSPTVNKNVQAPVPTVPRDPASLAARREAMGSAADSLHNRSAIVAPKPSPRLKLRPPSLLPSLPIGESVNSLYVAYRSRALQLGAARNACLSRAADAWRRGDGSAAKRFSREGHELNAKMAAELVLSAGSVVRERANLIEQVIRARDVAWSDDPGDNNVRGRACGNGLGVIMGIARHDPSAEQRDLKQEERMESVLDLHGIHAAEATEILEEFLLALEREHFYGLTYVVIGDEKHVGTHDPARVASRERLATGIRELLHRWGYPWSEREGVVCVDSATHL